MRSDMRESGAKDWYVAGAVALMAALYYGSYYNYGISLFDEGYLLNASERILLGQSPHADFYTVYAPGRFYAIALLFKLFGPGLLVARLFMLVLKVVTAALYYNVSRRLLARPAALVATIVYIIVPGNWHAVEITLLPLVFFLPMFAYLDSRRAGWLWAAGLVSAASLFIRQDIGVYMVLAGMVVLSADRLFVERARLLGREFMTGRALPFLLASSAAIPMYYWSSRGHLAAVLDDLFIRPVAFEENVSMPFNMVKLANGITGSLTLDNLVGVFFYIPPAVYVLTAALLIERIVRKKFGPDDVRILAVALLAVFSFKGVVVQSNVGHLLKVIPLSYMLTAYLAGRAWKTPVQAWRTAGRTAALGAACMAVAFVAVFVFTSYGRAFNSGSIGRRFVESVYLDLPRGGVYVPDYLRDVGPLAKYIKEHSAPDDPLMVIAHDSMIAFLAERKNPTRYDFFVSGILGDADQERTCEEALESKYVVYYEPPTFLGYPRGPALRFSNYCRTLYGCLLPHYSCVGDFGAYLLLERVDGEDPDTLHLIAGREYFLYGDYGRAVAELELVRPCTAAYAVAAKNIGWARSKLNAQKGKQG